MTAFVLIGALAALVPTQVHSEQQFTSKSELQCITTAIYHESRGESLLGQKMVAKTIINRAESGMWPKTACNVVYQKGQFSWTRHTRTAPRNETYRQLEKVALEVATTHDPKQATGCNKATFFTTGRFNFKVKHVCTIGRHNFYTH